jgi:hypothetical protein
MRVPGLGCYRRVDKTKYLIMTYHHKCHEIKEEEKGSDGARDPSRI